MLRAVRYSSEGREVVIDYYDEGTLFGMTSFCGWTVCDAGLRRNDYLAVEDSEVAVLSFADLKNRIAERPEILSSLITDYCHRLAMAYTRVESFVLGGAEEQLANILLLLAAQQTSAEDSVSLRPTITHEELSSLTGISRPFVSTIIGRFRERGWIGVSSSRQIVVHCQKIAAAIPEV